MAVPKRKTTPSRRNMRRAHHQLALPGSTECKNCGAMKRPHHICQACGWYDGQEVIAKKPATTVTETPAA